jgi:glycosyltransferase involved in cell wall biosynthesis
VKRLSVLHLITRLDRGGSSDCTLWQAMGAARRGHAVTLASGPSRAPAPLLEKARSQPNLTLVEIPALGRPPRPLRDLRALITIVRLLRRRRYDVIHLHTSKAGALGRVAALLLGRTRHVIQQPHGHLFHGYYARPGTLLVVAAERCLAPLARLHLTLTNAGAEEHLRRGVGRPGQFRTLPSGVDFRPLRVAAARRAECRRRLGYRDDEVVVGTLCRLEPIKGADALLRAFAQVAADRPRLRLFLGGDGPMEEPLRRQARALGVGERVRLSGAWAAPETVLPALDIFVLASRNEGMGRALVEAMALGIPVVGSAVGGIPELLEEGRAGLLVAPDEPKALASSIARLADEPGFAASLGRRGRARAVAYGAGRMIHGLLRLYEEVAA